MRVLRKTASGVALALASAAALFAATPAAATGPLTYIDFVGQCKDCADVGVGVLTLQNFQLGAALTAAEFVDFSYHSSLISFFEITSANLGSFSATFDALPGTAQVSIVQATPTVGFYFTLQTFTTTQMIPQVPDSNFDWEIGGGFIPDNPNGQIKPAGDGGGANQDFGLSFVWSQADTNALPTPLAGGGVPEPAAWALLIAGFGLAGHRLRSARRDAAKVAA